MLPVKLTAEEYEECEEGSNGICSACGEFRYGDTEPDAEDYPCDSCGKNKVVGMMNAMIDGLIEIVEISEVK